MHSSPQVTELQGELTQAKVVVEAATRECAELLEVISTNTAQAEVQQQAAQEKEQQLQVGVRGLRLWFSFEAGLERAARHVP